jgi:hypothetical protein
VTLLSVGDYENGWPLYDWRWTGKVATTMPLITSKAARCGAPHRRVLAWAEQGVGDELMFGALLPELRKASSGVIAKIDARLVPLFARSMPNDIVFIARRRQRKRL